MKCNEIRELLSPYIDHMLELNQMKILEEHLSTCDSCKKEYNELIEILSLLGQLKDVVIPDSFAFRLKNSLIEEKRDSIDSGAIRLQTRKKHSKWRILSSIAAIFTVGILSFGMYHDILGIVPDKLNGSDQAESIQMESDSALEDAAMLNDSANKEEAYDLRVSSIKEVEDASILQETNNYTGAMIDEDGSAPEPEMAAYGVSDSGFSDDKVKTESIEDRGFISKQVNQFNVEELNKYRMIMPIQEVESNSAAIKYYNNLIQEKLRDFDYEIIDYTYSLTGEWHFKIFIYKNKDGNTYNQEVLIIGRNGAIEVLNSNEIMGL